jgi:tRNA A-37 threonylcarbamoyl transferase component Bud32
MSNDFQGREASRAVAKPAPAWLGKKLGRFRLLGSIGQGAMGRVFRAEDSTLNRQVALKVLPNKMAIEDDGVAVEQFIREARSAATLEHPGVVHIYEVNQTDKIWYIAMELLEGGNLRELVKANGPMDMIRACQLSAEAAEALDYAHRAGIVHRDIKPANLMLTRTGRCKITDFGLARIDDANDSFHMGTENVGTPLYAAPEISRGLAAQASADIYSLGCTVYYLLSGTPPFHGTTAAEVLQLHQFEPPPDLCQSRPDLPPTLAHAIIKAMAKDPEDRFESAEQFAKVLRMHTIPVAGSGSQIGMMMQASGSGMVAPQPQPRNVRPLILWGSIAAVVLIAAGVFAAIYLGSRAPATMPPMLAAPPEAAVPPTPAPIAGPTPAPQVAAPESAAAQEPADDDAKPAKHAHDLPISLVPVATFRATQTSELMAIATGGNPALAGKTIAVVGQIVSIRPTPSGKSMRINFVGADGDSFAATCPPRLGEPIQNAFMGKQVKVVGVVQLHKTRAEIRIDSLDQIQPAN